MTQAALLEVTGLSLDAPGGRSLFRDLELSLGRERVALVGRNGVGKSTLLEVLAGHEVPERGRVVLRGKSRLVRQRLKPGDLGVSGIGLSSGELRRRCLERARRGRPDLLLLDEPTQDLDEDGIRWLESWLEEYEGGLLVVSHDRRLLRQFENFFVVAEAGCRVFSGSFAGLFSQLESESLERERKYVQNLNRLLDYEKHNDVVRRRRQRKKNVGRIRELDRAPSRALLNSKRSYAQESQGRRAVLQKERVAAMRAWAKATRRALSVQLPLEVTMQELPPDCGEAIVSLSEVAARVGGRTLFDDLSLELGRERLAVSGANGAGKTTLLEIMMGRRQPTLGRVTVHYDKVGYVAQNAENWCLEESLLERLLLEAGTRHPEEAAQLLAAHKFPFALAERPLASLSPGERVRAALICSFRRRPAVEMLVLDEPSEDLDFVGTAALESVLRAWPGGLVVVSHDREFLRAVGIDRHVVLGATHAHRRAPVRGPISTTTANQCRASNPPDRVGLSERWLALGSDPNDPPR